MLHYLLDLTTEDQKRRWLPGFAAGEVIGALAMTEPDAGSDLKGIRTSARSDGDRWILNWPEDLHFEWHHGRPRRCRRAHDAEGGSGAFSLFVVERDTPGVRGAVASWRRSACRVRTPPSCSSTTRSFPSANLLGEEGRGLHYLMSHLPRERLGVSAKAMATTRAIFELTCDYCQERTAFGIPLTGNQHVRFELAEMATEIDIAEAYVDKSVHGLQRRRALSRRRREG